MRWLKSRVGSMGDSQEVMIEQYKIGAHRLEVVENQSSTADKQFMTLIAMTAALFGFLVQIKLKENPDIALKGFVYASGIETLVAGTWFMKARGYRHKIEMLKEKLAEMENRFVLSPISDEIEGCRLLFEKSKKLILSPESTLLQFFIFFGFLSLWANLAYGALGNLAMCLVLIGMCVYAIVDGRKGKRNKTEQPE